MSTEQKHLQMLRRMYRIRFFEQRLSKFYDYCGYYAQNSAEMEAESSDDLMTCVSYDFASGGMIGGAVHLYIGEEAVAVGVCADLNSDDVIASTHRGHGHAIAKGADLRYTLAELMGRETGYSRGCGGSMHIFDMPDGILGGNGIVGAGMPIALGPAFAAKYRGGQQVSIGFFGDGAANQGTFHESMNLAALWKLPVIFVCENNLYANSTPAALSYPTEDLAPRAEGYGVPGVVVDGQDVLAVHQVASEAIARARRGEGPTMIEAKTFRFQGHCGIATEHQSPDECALWCKRDPIDIFEQKLLADGTLTPEAREDIRAEIAAEVDEAEEFAKQSPLPEPAMLGV
jgi:pyruvate dehydrogenase E1 component alpha subunit